MKKYIYSLVFIWLGCLMLAAHSDAALCGGNSNTIIVHINGIGTTLFDALNRNLPVLDARVRSSISQEEYELISFDLQHNSTYRDEYGKIVGILLDLFEASLQDIQTDVGQFWRILGGIKVMPQWFSNRFTELAVSIDESAMVTSVDLADQVAYYKRKIAEGNKVVLVPHSQGNFFANQAYGNLNGEESQSLGIVSVANPDSYVASGDQYYTTLINDTVILAIIAAKSQISGLPLPMIPNTINSFESWNDMSGHSFVHSYMVEGSNSNQQVVEDIITMIDSLVSPGTIIESGVITVTLTWGAQPDVDLHVYEPNGTHVFWANRVGLSGYLDRDDVTSYGPEHYYVVSCDSLEQGTYNVGLDYWYGTGPETATVQIEAGLSVRTYVIPMASPSFGSMYSPVSIANILVTEGPNGGYQFQIQ